MCSLICRCILDVDTTTTLNVDRVFSAYLYATPHHFGVPSISCKLVSVLGSIGLSTYQKNKTTFRTLTVAKHFYTDDPALEEEEDEILVARKATYATVDGVFPASTSDIVLPTAASTASSSHASASASVRDLL